MSKKGSLNLDERDINIVRKICTTLYLITLYSLIGVQLYRQFVLHQAIEEHEDIAIIIAFNVVVFLGSLLYISGGVNPQKVKLRRIIAGYVGFVLIGFIFTVFKYTILLGQELSLMQVVNYFFTVLKVSGLLAIAWGLLAYLGNRRIEKQIE
jgi:hypothetical protein